MCSKHNFDTAKEYSLVGSKFFEVFVVNVYDCAIVFIFTTERQSR